MHDAHFWGQELVKNGQGAALHRESGAAGEVRRIERELMLLGRHAALGPRRACPAGGPDRLERSAYLLLSRIEAAGPMSIGQLAAAFGLDCSTVNRQTAAVVRAGLAERIPDPEGGTARKLRITGEGLTRLHRDRAARQDALRDVLGDWSPQDRDTLARLLARYNDAVERMCGEEPWPRD
jgi:DNA-binding MarR family transcriptional regulator